MRVISECGKRIVLQGVFVVAIGLAEGCLNQIFLLMPKLSDHSCCEIGSWLSVRLVGTLATLPAKQPGGKLPALESGPAICADPSIERLERLGLPFCCARESR